MKLTSLSSIKRSIKRNVTSDNINTQVRSFSKGYVGTTQLIVGLNIAACVVCPVSIPARIGLGIIGYSLSKSGIRNLKDGFTNTKRITTRVPRSLNISIKV
jgi:hypothetical protein